MSCFDRNDRIMQADIQNKSKKKFTNKVYKLKHL